MPNSRSDTILFRISRRLFHSPTWTAWGAKCAQSLRLFLLLPLLLNHFDSTQISAWFLFSSLLFLSTTVGEQISLLFTRMVSMANGGASDLSPIKSKDSVQTTGTQNWGMIERLYGTLQSLNLITSVLALPILVAVGIFSLDPLLSDYAGAQEIWIAFGIFTGSQFIQQFYRRYQVMMRGLNHVALFNRIAIFTALLSIVCSVVTLLLKGNIVWLMLVTEIFVLLNLVIYWYLLTRRLDPRLRTIKSWGWDRQILRWIGTPLWRSLIQVTANRGASRIAAVFLARHADANTLSAVLLAMRLLEGGDGFSYAPIISRVPQYGHMLGSGNISGFQRGIIHSIRQAQWLLVLFVIACGYSIYYLLPLIGSDIKFLPQTTFFLLATAFVLMTSIRLSVLISLIGNNVVAVERFVISALLTLLLSIVLIPRLADIGFIIAAFVPTILVTNVKPLRIGCQLLGIRASMFYRKTCLIPHLLLAIALLTTWALPIESISHRAAQWTIQNVGKLSPFNSDARESAPAAAFENNQQLK